MPSPKDLVEHNPDRYARLAEPHASKETLTDNVTNFFREVGELREKYKIPEVLIVAGGYYKDEKGVAGLGLADMQYGKIALRPQIVLYLYRQESEMMQALIEGLST